MSRKFVKRDERTLQAVDSNGSVVEYNFEFLQRQRMQIRAQRANELRMRDAELAEVEELLRHCERLDITELGKTRGAVTIAHASEADAQDIEPLPPAPPKPGLLKRISKRMTKPL